MRPEFNGMIGAASAVLWPLYQPVVKKELSWRQNYQFTTLAYGHELWVVTEKMRL